MHCQTTGSNPFAVLTAVVAPAIPGEPSREFAHARTAMVRETRLAIESLRKSAHPQGAPADNRLLRYRLFIAALNSLRVCITRKIASRVTIPMMLAVPSSP